jgi:uncharacterized protein YacL
MVTFTSDVTGLHTEGAVDRMNSADIAAVIIGVAFLILVGVIFVTAIVTMNTLTDFLMVWTAVGPIVGVVIGLIPAHFFRSMAEDAHDKMMKMAMEKWLL